MNIFIFNYNNYYNRILKINNTIEEYGMHIHALYDVKDFNPRDMVNTEHLFGSNINSYDGSGDYAVITDEKNTIISRWFIIEATFLRQGQWKLILRRDLLADFYNEVINADTFIEKATLAYDDPLIFNNENFSVNQIKTRETLLKDSSGCAWLVGYYSRGTATFTTSVPTNQKTSTDRIVLTTPIEDWSYYKYTNEATPFHGGIQECSYEILAQVPSGKNYVLYRNDYRTGELIYAKESDLFSTSNTSLKLTTFGLYQYNDGLKEAYSGYLSMLESQLIGYINYNYKVNVESFLSLNGKLVEDSNGKVFRISLGKTGTIHESAHITAGSMFNTLKNVVSGAYYGDKKIFTGTPNQETFKVGANVTTYTLVLNEESYNQGITATIAEDKIITEDAPWNIFAIPYGAVTIKNQQGSTIVTTNADLGLRTAMAMLAQHPGVIYDIQLLPYCPFDGLQANGSIVVESSTQYDEIRDDNGIIGVVLHIQRSQFTKTIYGYTQGYNNSSIGKKLHNECDKWRLTAPNYSNYFDFSVEKNNGIAAFNIDCDYKPFAPYIHINPDFKGLYGYDDNGPRGLVCGGDYSLSSIIDQWEQYQIQNKNFQLTFDRQIQNMEVQNNIARVQEKWQAAVGTVQGAMSGAVTGGVVGGAYGAVAGAVVGGAASLAGGLADIKYNEMLRTEAIDYTKDLFGYQLGNIQALPNTISKVSALNNNNKIFPILEFYTCTEREKNAFLNKIAFNGMTVMTIGKISDYLGNNWSYNGISSKGYIKGKIIRLNIPGQDFHLINEISGEIFKGVYTIWE